MSSTGRLTSSAADIDVHPIGQPPEENCYARFYAYKDSVTVKVGLESVVGLGSPFSIRVFTVRVFYLATVRQNKHGKNYMIK